jgi:hypothetical protein
MRRENWRGGSAILDAWCHVGRARVPQISISNHLVRFSADLMPPLFRPSRFFFFPLREKRIRQEVNSARSGPSPDGSCPGVVGSKAELALTWIRPKIRRHGAVGGKGDRVATAAAPCLLSFFFVANPG